MKISFCMIVRDEEEVLGRALKAIAGLHDELIIVDTGSTDRTKEIAQEFGAVVHDFPWIDDFGKARQFAADHCQHEIIGYCDADMVLDGDPAKVREIILASFEDPAIGQFCAPYVWGEYHPDSPPSLVYHLPWFYRREAYRWHGAVHEYIKSVGEVLQAARSDAFGYGHRRSSKAPEHKDRNLRILRKVIGSGDATPRDWFYYGRECTYHGQWAECIVALERYVPMSNFPQEHHRALYELANAYHQINDKNKAMGWAVKAVATGSSSSEPYILIGRLFLDAGLVELALSWFAHAGQLPKPDVEWFDYLPARTYEPLEWQAICLWKLGEIDKAKQAHQAAKKFDPNAAWLIENDKWLS